MSLKRLIPLLDRVLVRFDLNLFHFSRSKSTHHVQVERLTAKTQIGGMCDHFPPHVQRVAAGLRSHAHSSVTSPKLRKTN